MLKQCHKPAMTGNGWYLPAIKMVIDLGDGADGINHLTWLGPPRPGSLQPKLLQELLCLRLGQGPAQFEEPMVNIWLDGLVKTTYLMGKNRWVCCRCSLKTNPLNDESMVKLDGKLGYYGEIEAEFWNCAVQGPCLQQETGRFVRKPNSSMEDHGSGRSYFWSHD